MTSPNLRRIELSRALADTAVTEPSHRSDQLAYSTTAQRIPEQPNRTAAAMRSWAASTPNIGPTRDSVQPRTADETSRQKLCLKKPTWQIAYLGSAQWRPIILPREENV